jgi:hypothetical protein
MDAFLSYRARDDLQGPELPFAGPRLDLGHSATAGRKESGMSSKLISAG